MHGLKEMLNIALCETCLLCCYISLQIYQSSVAYSPDAIQTSGGYFHLGRVFLMEGKIDIADSLHSRVKHDNFGQ